MEPDVTLTVSAEETAEFDPRPYLIEVQGGAPYLQVKHRLLWLTKKYPSTQVLVDFVTFTPDGLGAVVKARVAISDPSAPGGVRVGEDVAMHRETQIAKDFVANAATSALGRALAKIGLGTEFALAEFDEGTEADGTPKLADAPANVRRIQPPAQQQPAREPAQFRTAQNQQARPQQGGFQQPYSGQAIKDPGAPASKPQLGKLFALGMNEFGGNRVAFSEWRGPEDQITKQAASRVIEYLVNREAAGLTGSGDIDDFDAVVAGVVSPSGPQPAEDNDDFPF